MNRQTILSFIVLLTCLNAGDTGKIMGSIFSSANGEPLIGANISIQGTVIGTSSDINGEFNLFNVPLGEQTIVASHIAHETRYYPVRMEHNKIISLIIKLPVKPIELQSIPVTGKVDGNHENGVLFKKKKSTLIEDGISSDQIAQNGDANAAEALRRITGASLKDGKYITIRGLEGRYVDTQVNGSPVASPEPDKKSIPLTLFPSALLESIIVIKTYSPDLPGAFAGGFVNIKTKAYPDKYLLNYQFSVKDNSSLHQGLSFNRSDGGAIDYL
ncbi:MAG: TonB-dependent receptor, partial [Fidelibacterota bacterium]